MTTCRSCGAEIFWAHTKNGKGMPLDIEPREDGNVKVIGGSAFVGGLQLLDPGQRNALEEAVAARLTLPAETRLAEALAEIELKCRWYADNAGRDPQEVDHALCVEILDLAEKALDV